MGTWKIVLIFLLKKSSNKSDQKCQCTLKKCFVKTRKQSSPKISSLIFIEKITRESEFTVFISIRFHFVGEIHETLASMKNLAKSTF